jgi:hypothetical protein
MAQAIRHGYKEVFERSEYAYDLEKNKFKNLIIEMTGLEPGDATVNRCWFEPLIYDQPQPARNI